MTILTVISAAGLDPIGLHATEVPAEDVDVTVYNSPLDAPTTMRMHGLPAKPGGWALVRQRQKIQLQQGINAFSISNVAASIVHGAKAISAVAA